MTKQNDPPAVRTTIQRASDHIRDKILSGEFQPGHVISEASLARELGVSRTPVGEALRELAGIGFVEQVPRYGTIVRQISRGEIIELYELREALEPYAVALAVERIGKEQIDQLQKLCDRLETFEKELEKAGRDRLDGEALREFLATDMAFHALLIHSAGNARIARLVRDSHVMTQLFGTQRLVHNRKVVQEACQFHARILDAVTRHDAEAARSMAAAHIRTSLANTLENLDRYRGDLGTLPTDVREELERIEMGLTHPKTKTRR